MKLIWLLIIGLALTACSPDKDLTPRIVQPGGNKPGANEKPQTGDIINVNGTWTGKGSARFQGQEFENLDFVVRVSDIPLRLTAQLEITSGGKNFFDMQLGAYNIEKNSIQEHPSKRVIGSIGSLGFVINSSKNLKFSLTVKEKKATVAGIYANLDGRLEYKAILSNSQFEVVTHFAN